MHDELRLLISLAISLVLALALGLITDWLRLSPIVGYLLAGVALGRHTPGFVAHEDMAKLFSEIGVVLLMFGVGLHFDLRDLLAVKRVAIPGAIGQIAVAMLLGTVAVLTFGLPFFDPVIGVHLSWTSSSGLVIGIAISVASTVVLVRVLMDNDVLHTPHGHIAVGWLIVEDIFTVLVLVFLPGIAGVPGEQAEGEQSVFVALALAVGKVAALTLIVLGGGRKVIPWLLHYVARSRSRELFTLTVFALALAVAVGSYALFGVSMALGAFLAGMMVGQTEVSHQAAADALPMRDAFAVLFFVSVGMLFDPRVIVDQPGLLVGLLAIVLIAKPVTALLIVWALRYSVRSALTVAVGLAQIGEFSFLLANEAAKPQVGLLSAQGQSLLVACALISITLNPILFRAINPLEKWLRTKHSLWQLLSQRSEAGGTQLNVEMQARLAKADEAEEPAIKAVVVGYGPVGQTASRILKEFHIQPVVIDLNLDTIRGVAASGGTGVYGDATRREILMSAGIGQAKYLLVTTPDVLVRTSVIITAKELNPDLRVFARARYLQEKAWLEEIGATDICTEEGETAVGLAALLLRQVGASEERIRKETRKIQRELGLRQSDAGRDTEITH
jgi:CPA2 family monovalent cation:H+ antiporter-2